MTPTKLLSKEHYLPPPTPTPTSIVNSPHFYKKILITPSIIFQKSQPPSINKGGFTLYYSEVYEVYSEYYFHKSEKICILKEFLLGLGLHKFYLCVANATYFVAGITSNDFS